MGENQPYLTIYTSYGATFQFRQVSNLRDDAFLNAIRFDYISAGTGAKQKAVFARSQLLGYTCSAEL